MDPQTVLNDIQVILKEASIKCEVLDEKFPAKFFENNPEKIFESYFKFIKNRSNSEGVIRNEDKLALTSIAERFANGEYIAADNGFYKLYHDVKLVCTMLIHFNAQGTRMYQLVDKFYKFATELILRECYKIGITVVDTIGNDNLNMDSTPTELDKIIGKDFIKISTSYKVPISQTYHIKTKELDLFSSIITRSHLETRPQELPNSNFEINNVIAQTNLEQDSPKLGFLAANTSNIPDPTLPPTEMMSRFLHPNWYALPTTMWLKYGDYKSWAPTFNENGTVLDSKIRGIMWLKRIGYMEILEREAKKNGAVNQLKDEKNDNEDKSQSKKDESTKDLHKDTIDEASF